MPRGWSPDALPLVSFDENTWTIAEAAVALTLTGRQAVELRNQIKFTHVFPVGRRRSLIPARPPGDKSYSSKGGTQGRYAKVYPADELTELVELLGLNGPRYLTSENQPVDGSRGSRRRGDSATPSAS